MLLLEMEFAFDVCFYIVIEIVDESLRELGGEIVDENNCADRMEKDGIFPLDSWSR